MADVVKIELQDGYLFGRGISRGTAAKYDVAGAKQYIRAVGKETDCVVFPYHDMEGMYYGSKYRSISDKGFSCSAPLKDLWRIDLVDLDKSEDIIITEGEIDALSIAECGFANVVSIPNGANQSSSDDAFPYLWNGREKLDKAKRIILAGDSDKVGQNTQEEIARRLGKHRVWRIVWPSGIKDANDALLQGGIEGLKRLVDGAEPWPVSGLYDASHFFEEVKAIQKNGLESGASTGYTLVDEYYTVAPGLLTIVTGIPNSGKSEFIDQIMCNLAERDGWRFALCSFENPPPIHIMKLVAKHLRSNTWEHQIPTEEFDDALEWVQRHFSFLYHADGSLSDLDSILERLRVAVMRYGIRGTVIDPYNYIQRPNTSTETEWISDMLTKIKAFCMAHGVHCFFIAHPTKMPRSEGGTTVIPTGYDISGCYSSDTEVLTKRGWITHDLVTASDEVMCFDSGELAWHMPIAVHKYDYAGEMHHWTGYGLDLMVTPNHRMVVKDGEGWSFVESKDVKSSRHRRPLLGKEVATVGSLPDFGLDASDEDIAWFIGFWVAEGHVSQNSLSVCQAEGKHLVPKRVMDRIGFAYKDTISTGRASEKRMWVARLLRKWHIDFIDAIESKCGNGCSNKVVPDFIWGTKPSIKKAFLDGYWYGDGSTRKEVREAYTTSRLLADGLMRLALECGFSVSGRMDYTKNPKWLDRYVVRWGSRAERELSADKNRDIVHYDGKVYCLTVPGGAYVTRRKYKPVICGNSAHFFNKADCGISVHREEGVDIVTIKVWKIRFAWHGKKGQVKITYDPATTTYSDGMSDDVMDITASEEDLRYGT